MHVPLGVYIIYSIEAEISIKKTIAEGAILRLEIFYIKVLFWRKISFVTSSIDFNNTTTSAILSLFVAAVLETRVRPATDKQAPAGRVGGTSAQPNRVWKL